MDKNTITGLILIFLVFIGFSIYNNNKLNKGFKNAVAAAEEQVANGNFERARTEYVNALRFKPNQPEVLAKINELNNKLGITTGNQIQDTINTILPEKNITQSAAGTETVEPGQFGAFAGAAVGENEFITLENNLLELKISLKGGRVYSARLKEYVTHDSLPLILFSGDSTVFGFNFFTADNKAVQTNNLYFSPSSEERSISVTNDPGLVVLRLNADSDKYIEYKYTLPPDKYHVLFDVSFHNMDKIMPANQNSITLDWRMYIPQKEKGRINEENYTSLKYKYYQDDVEGTRMRSKKASEQIEIPTRLSWVAYVDQFFSAAVITDSYFLNGSLTSNMTPESKKYIRYFTSEIGVPVTPGPDMSYQMRFYYGPNHTSTLKKEGLELEKIIYLGKNITGWISRFVIIPVFNWLEKYIKSYGLIILILTILIKIVLFPLTFKSYQSQAKMQVLKPLVDELGKKFPKKEDAMKKQQATMDLYKRAGINPMGGCLPMLLQFPILFAMFRFFPVSIELRQEHFLWATDLSTYDSILTLPFSIPIYGSHVSLFTLLMTASSLLTMKMSGSSAGQDQPGMKMMMYMMPVMFMLILNQWSSGLTYYYFLANMLTWIQNVISKRFIDAEKVLAVLEENKKKPLKKSKWQQRLEEAAKQRGINPPKR
ncbi:MAG TPA: membrane protein insertase YidC [Bacteroidales bacterium]|jgi:YidC/Oxa1 family membrane protein insertase|nr:membrane protein insertase YidC [Bacteroidales bacterium]OQB65694.1 MAG: Membrane protein insertase YidC [Bacteroidetes bacterium ADurb.Bin145]HOU02147.1 membrane protein insertase YidC [Bacteroidales bacterium]HQK67519.1 membrane protein insertase YidC [Bacteroidales bacterium]